MSGISTGADDQIQLRQRPSLKRPSNYTVIMLNDDYTTMEFVIDCLVSIFKQDAEHAYSVMLDVHTKGAGICGVYSKEIAETRISIVHSRARKAGFPLQCIMEKNDD
ncbi:MAG: ATP-dependent Clp protease adapter ClpS [Leptospiraceae bacterium]|nr:ATP-dependent Clp protease adapter ClpS [Leptospiraceae bacterium]